MNNIFGSFNKREVKKIKKIADKVLRLEDSMKGLSDQELSHKTEEFKRALRNGKTLDDILPEAYAAVREADYRVLGMKPYPVQVMGGIVLHQGRIAEMETGAGKTLVATMPVYLNALSGKGVHVITVNDYLAERDMEWMGRTYQFMGLKVDSLLNKKEGEERKAVYDADIIYGTNSEFGFDYLRDNMAEDINEQMQKELNFALVDEVDSILIDEARTPLIISGQGDDSVEEYEKANAFVQTLKGGKKDADAPKDEDEEKYGDFVVYEKDKQVALTDKGVSRCEKFYGIDNFSDIENMEINHYVMQALKANYIMHRDIDYIVKDNEVLIVDEFTGRIMNGRRFSDGLHQAIECKENIDIKGESKTLATITIQNYFRMYNKLSGMTGTAKTEEEEFREIYNMDVVTIPPNKPIIREDLPDAVYISERAKYKAVCDKVEEAHKKGQPVLVGTVSVEKSEKVAELLRKRGISEFNVLNAKHHEQEAAIVAEAGRKGAITIATNMAGRGTDIILGGNPEFEAKVQMQKAGYSKELINEAIGINQTNDKDVLKARKVFKNLKAQISEERKPEQRLVKKLGGLFIVGTERHESRRVDNQLRGRAGRQGDPGKSQFCVSMDDDLMRLFGGERLKNVMKRLSNDEFAPIESGTVTRSIENAQKKIEGRNFNARKYVLQYDNVMNKQRLIVYKSRQRILKGENMKPQIEAMTNRVIDNIIDPVVADTPYAQEWDWNKLNEDLKSISPLFGGFELEEEALGDVNEDILREDVKEAFRKIYKIKEEENGEDNMRAIERMVLLRQVDTKWIGHIDAMDQLRNGIGLRGIGGMDPAAEYAKEGFEMYEALLNSIEEDTVRYCYAATLVA